MKLGTFTRGIFHRGATTLAVNPSIYRYEKGVPFAPGFRLPPANGITDPYLNELGVIETAKPVSGNPRALGSSRVVTPSNQGTYLPFE